MDKLLITGASSGLGKSLSLHCLKRGYSVVGLARRADTLDAPNYHPWCLDLSADNVEASFKELTHMHADVSHIILAAGVGQFAGLESFSKAQIDELMQVNFTSQVILLKHFLPLFKRQGQHKIILIGSESSLHGGKQGSIYCATKFALRGFAQSLRLELAKFQIPVTLINPGLCRTPFFDELHFKPGPKPQHAIEPAVINQTVEYLLNLDPNCVVEEINLQPLQKVIEK